MYKHIHCVALGRCCTVCCAMPVSNQFWLSTLKHAVVAASSVYIQLKHPFLGASGLHSKWEIEMYLTAIQLERTNTQHIWKVYLFVFLLSKKQSLTWMKNQFYHMHLFCIIKWFGFRFVYTQKKNLIQTTKRYEWQWMT